MGLLTKYTQFNECFNNSFLIILYINYYILYKYIIARKNSNATLKEVLEFLYFTLKTLTKAKNVIYKTFIIHNIRSFSSISITSIWSAASKKSVG